MERISRERISTPLRPKSVLTREQLEWAFQNAAEKVELGEAILDETATLVRLPDLEGIELECPLGWIAPNPAQPRENFDPKKLEDLGERIKILGQRQAIQVVPYMDGEKIGFFLIDGERRYRACQIINRKTIRMVVEWQDSLEKIFDASLTANLDREAHNPIELANAYRKMIDFIEKNPDREDKRPGATIVSEKYGISVSTINNYLRFLDFPPELQHLIIEGKINASGATTLEKARIHDRRLADKDKETLRLKIIAQRLIREIAQEESGVTGKNNKPKRITGALTKGVLSKAAEDAVLETQGPEVAAQIRITRALLKCIDGFRLLDTYMPEVLDRENSLSIRNAARRLGNRSTPETVRGMAITVRDRVNSFIEIMEKSTRPEPNPVNPDKPTFTEYIQNIPVEKFGGDADLRLMALELADVTDSDGNVVTIAQISEITLIDTNVAAGKLKGLRSALAGIGIILEEHIVRRRDSVGSMAKTNAYRLNYDSQFDETATNEQVAETQPAEAPQNNVQKGKTEAPQPALTEPAPQKRLSITPHIIPAEGVSKELQEAVVSYFTGLINDRQSVPEIHHVCGNTIVIKLSCNPKRTTLTVSTNIMHFGTNFGMYVRSLVAEYRAADPKAPGILLGEIRRSEDLV